jgi:polysulfide reductase chain C
MVTKMVVLDLTWGWYIAWYLFLAGVGAGAYLTGTIADYLDEKYRLASKIAVALGAPLVAIGTIFLVLDLGHPERFMLVFGSPTSMITIGSTIISVFMILGLVHLGFWIWPFKTLEKNNAARRALGLLGAIFAVGTAVYTGILLGVVNAIPFWNNSILPMLFLVSATSTGIGAVVAGLAIYHARRTGEERKNILDSIKMLGKCDVGLIVLELIVLFFYLAVSSTISPTASEAVQLLAYGSLAPLFWGGLVVAGLLLPLAIEASGMIREKTLAAATLVMSAAISGILVLLGGLVLRYSVLLAGVSLAPPHYFPGQEIYFAGYPPQFASAFLPTYGPSALDYAVIGVFFLILVVAYFVASKILPAPRVVTAERV